MILEVIGQLPPLPTRDSRPFDVVGFGQNSVDLVVVVDEYPAPDSSVMAERLVRLPGGEIATAMVACARLGCRARYLGTVGTDEAGATVKAVLRVEGVDVSCVREVDGPNRTAVILVDHTGRRTVIAHRDAALSTPVDAVNLAAVTSGRLLLVDAIDPLASAAAAQAARVEGVPTVVDVDQARPGLDALLRTVDVLVASGPFAVAYTAAASVGQALQRLMAEFRPAAVVATLGAEGSLALCAGIETQTLAFDVPVVDTTGAGDAFRGGLVASWLRFGAEADLATLLLYASAVAGLNCGAVGAQTALPQWSAVDVLVTRAEYERSNR